MGESKIVRRGGGGIDVSDATALTTDVLSGKTFYAGDENIKTGTIASKGAETFTPSTSNQTIASGQYLSGTQTILGDANLVAGNIKDGVTIFGVTGTAQTVTNYLSFDGVDDYVNTNYALQLSSNFHTTYSEVYIPSGLTYGGAIFGLAHSSSTFSFFRITFNPETNLIQHTGFGGSGERIDIDFTPFLNQWVKIITRHNGSNKTMFIQSLATSQQKGVSGRLNGTRTLFLGAINNKGTPSSFLDFKMRKFALFLRDSDNTQVESLFNNGVDLNDSSLQIYYEFDEGSGNTLNDSVGNNDGTIVGATWEQE